MVSRQRFVLSLVVASCVGVVAVGCSEPDTSQGAPSRSKLNLSKIEIPDAELSVTVDGQPLPDVDLTKFQCYRTSDDIYVHGQDPTDGRPGLAVDLQPGNPPKVEGVSFAIDGVNYTADFYKGSAEVTQDGSRITIRGTAESYDLTPPVTKRYEIAVTLRLKDRSSVSHRTDHCQSGNSSSSLVTLSADSRPDRNSLRRFATHRPILKLSMVAVRGALLVPCAAT